MQPSGDVRLVHSVTSADTFGVTKELCCAAESVLTAAYIQWTIKAAGRCIRYSISARGVQAGFSRGTNSRPHSATASHVLVQFPCPQKVGPNPQYSPLQQPDTHSLVAEQEPVAWAAESCRNERTIARAIVAILKENIMSTMSVSIPFAMPLWNQFVEGPSVYTFGLGMPKALRSKVTSICGTTPCQNPSQLAESWCCRYSFKLPLPALLITSGTQCDSKCG